MELPAGRYSKADFIEYVLEHGEEVAPPDPRHRWLKVYSVLAGHVPWRSALFTNAQTSEFGDITEVRFGRDSTPGLERDENYYVMEHSPGLLLLFTTAVKERYEQTIRERLRQVRGITELWSSPSVFDRQWRFILRQSGGFVYRFMSRRSSIDEATAAIRPDYRRRFNYTGNDATHVIDELRESYGVLPRSLYIRVGPDLNVHLTNEGLFSAKIMSRQAFELFFGMLDLIQEEILGLKKTSQDLAFRVESLSEPVADSPKVVAVQAGVIRLSERDFDVDAVGTLRDELARRGQFSLIDEQLQRGSIGFTATVIDERKGTVFNISASDNQIVLIPKHNITFESFISFYRTVAEVADPRATFRLYT